MSNINQIFLISTQYLLILEHLQLLFLYLQTSKNDLNIKTFMALRSEVITVNAESQVSHGWNDGFVNSFL